MEVKDMGGGGGGDGLIDRSKVRILLCDNDSKSSREVLSLLLKCSYQVTSVRSARQVIDALNAEVPDIDIILAEVDLPMRKGMKMLKYITRDKDLRRIPVIMMSAQDEVSIVVKCLRLGAADYLVKPLRTNELLNLWTHMWRRRRMLGLAEKNILNCEFDLVASDPSDANTNSTTLFSDDTDDKSRKSMNPEMGISNHPEDEHAVAATDAVEHCPCDPEVPGISDCRTGHISSSPMKSKLKIGESSAFFTYVKSGTVKNTSKVINHIEDKNAPRNMRIEDNRVQECGPKVNNNATVHENGEVWENYSQGDDLRSSTSFPDSLSLDRSCTTPSSREYYQHGNFNEGSNLHQVLMHHRNESQVDGSGLPTQNVYPYYPSAFMNQVMMQSASHLYQKYLQEFQNQANSTIPQYNHLPQCHNGVTGMPPLSYYPVNICLQPGQMPNSHQWPQISSGGTSSNDATPSKLDRREAALVKFRQKRKERCFDKKIRYVNRKKLAERRPRVRGQFVRKANGVDVDLNGQPTPTDYDDEEDEDEDEIALRDFPPEDNV